MQLKSTQRQLTNIPGHRQEQETGGIKRIWLGFFSLLFYFQQSNILITRIQPSENQGISDMLARKIPNKTKCT